jgi:Membrane domain of glycerophosphoryl diester phosphodiesterase
VKDWYAVLEVLPSASIERITEAYESKVAAGPEAAERVELDQAFWVLSDQDRRIAYDAVRGAGPSPRSEVDGGRMGPTQVFGDAFGLLRAHPGRLMAPTLAVELLLAIGLGVATIVLFLVVYSDEPFKGMTAFERRMPASLLFSLAVLLAIQLLFGQVARAGTMVAARAVSRGEPISLSGALDPPFTRMGGLIVVTMLYTGAVVALVFTIVGIPFALYFLVRFGLSLEAFILDGLRPVDAMRASWRATRGRTLRLIGVVVLGAMAAFVPVVLSGILGLAITGSRDQEVITSAGVTILQTLIQVPMLAFFSIMTTLFYLRARGGADVSGDARI